MWIKKLAGVTLVAAGIGCLGHYVDRCYHPTGEDRAFWARVADSGGISATEGRGPAWKFFLLGFGATGLGAKLFKES